MRNRLLTAAFLMTAATMGSMAQNETTFSYSTPGAEASPYGFAYLEEYNAAIWINNEDLIKDGAKIIGARVQVHKDYPGIKNYSMWLSENINMNMQSGEQFIPDVVSVPTEEVDGYCTVEFPEPYTLTDKGVYLGYTFTFESYNNGIYYPFLMTTEANRHGFYLRTRNTLYNWGDYSETFTKTLTITALLEGDFTNDEAEVKSVTDAYTTPGVAQKSTVTIANTGSTYINSIEYNYSYAGETFEGRKEFSKPLNNIPGTEAQFDIDIPAREEYGSEELVFNLLKVNESDNASPNAVYRSHVSVVDHIPTKRALMEEYTGLWCTYCVRGIAGMQLMNTEFEDFCGYAIHYNDVLQPSKNIPGNPQTVMYPTAMLDRHLSYDPYYGNAGMSVPGHIVTNYRELSEEFAPADFSVDAFWPLNEEGKDQASVLEITTTTNFVLTPYDDSRYSIEYAIVADGLCSDDPFDDAWWQINYYAGSNPDTAPEELKEWCTLPNEVVGLTFNDVMACRVVDRDYLDVKLNEPLTNTYRLNLNEECIGLKGTNLVPDKNLLRVVASLVKTAKDGSQTIANSAVVFVPSPAFVEDENGNNGGPGAVNDLYTGDGVEAEYMTLSGMKATPASGNVYIKVLKGADGSRKAEKVYIK